MLLLNISILRQYEVRNMKKFEKPAIENVKIVNEAITNVDLSMGDKWDDVPE